MKIRKQNPNNRTPAQIEKDARKDAKREALVALLKESKARETEALNSEKAYDKSVAEVDGIAAMIKKLERQKELMQKRIDKLGLQHDRKTKALTGKKKVMDTRFKQWHTMEDRVAKSMPKIKEFDLLREPVKRTRKAKEEPCETAEVA